MIAMPAYVESSVRLQPDVPLRVTAHGRSGEYPAFVTVQIGPDLGAVTLFAGDPAELDRLAATLGEAKAALLAKKSKAVA